MNMLITCALLLQDKTAEETFRKIEDAITKAKTVSVNYKSEVDRFYGRPESFKYEGTLLLKEGNKVYIAIKGQDERGTSSSMMVSDGTTLEMNPELREQPGDAPKNLREAFLVALARGGVCQAKELSNFLILYRQDGSPDYRELFSLSNFKAGEDDEGRKTLTYRLTVKVYKKQQDYDVKLWYDPKTYRPVKRELNYRDESRRLTIVDSFSEFVLNADIADEKFKVPADK